MDHHELAERFVGVLEQAAEGFVAFALAIPAWLNHERDDFAGGATGEQRMVVRPSLH